MITVRHVAGLVRGVRYVAAYGEFNALHRGHGRLLLALRELADRQAASALVVLTGARQGRGAAAPLASIRQRLRFMERSGADALLLRRRAVLGVDWPLLRQSGVTTLVTASAVSPPAGEAIRVQRIDPVMDGGVPIGDEAVRVAIDGADLASALRLLGRAYAIEGRVVHGFHRGGPLGVPTANLRVRDQQLPPDGVYAVRGRVLGRLLGGVANIGFKPTFGDHQRSVETHLLDFAGDLYGRMLEIEFLRGIRGERKFDSIDDLLAQIRCDIAAARQILAES